MGLSLPELSILEGDLFLPCHMSHVLLMYFLASSGLGQGNISEVPPILKMGKTRLENMHMCSQKIVAVSFCR